MATIGRITHNTRMNRTCVVTQTTLQYGGIKILDTFAQNLASLAKMISHRLREPWKVLQYMVSLLRNKHHRNYIRMSLFSVVTIHLVSVSGHIR